MLIDDIDYVIFRHLDPAATRQFMDGAFRHAGIEPGRQPIQRLAARHPEAPPHEGRLALAVT